MKNNYCITDNKLLFVASLQVNAVDALGETALHRAAAAGQISACRILLSHGADISLRSFQGHTAAEVASEPVQKILQGKMCTVVCYTRRSM